MSVPPAVATVAGFSHVHIQRAIDSLPSGGTVHLPRGTYHLERTIVITSHITIAGDGPQSTHIVLAPGSNSHMFVNRDRDGNEGIELRGFSLDGDMANQHPPFAGARAFAFGAFFRNVRGITVDSVELRRIFQNALQLNDCRNVTITNVDASELGGSVVATSASDDLVLRKVTVIGAALAATHSGVHVRGCTRGYIEASVDGCSGNGIMLDAQSTPLTDVVVRAVARRCQRGLLLSGGDGHAVGNVFLTGEYSDNRECGIMVSNATNVFIVDAAINGNAERGIVLQGRNGARHCVIADCRIADNRIAVEERDGSRDNYRTANVTS